MKGERKEADKALRNLINRIKAIEKTGEKIPGEIASLKAEVAKQEAEIKMIDDQIFEDEARIARHLELEEELKQCRKVIKEIKAKKQVLVDVARSKISPAEAKALILERWKRTLHDTVNGYLQSHQRHLLQSIEQLWDKYTTPLHSILSEREKETELLNDFLKELGYE